MSISFIPEGEARNVQRHRLRFKTKDDFNKAILMNKQKGYIVFHSGENRRLVGQIVLVFPEDFAVEVDAAADEAKDQT
ncbi:MAG: hypothetical protein ISN26_08065 [Betaproteobacteria bacterium AqS2]|uniref:Uncharacterized protein n=1 Tax=Candidatus Amphirhobacter heronislandensis TaxID=1732024 RepID=A0A930XYL5_9GAMM|nr:hypothetical protein [Betaproteobacteria bacterium AqS2]